MAQLYLCFILHSKSFPTTPYMPKSEFKRRSYVINKLEKKNKLLSTNYVATFLDYVAIKPTTKQETLSRQSLLCCYKAKDKLCRNNFFFCRNKVFLCRNKVLSRKESYLCSDFQEAL